MMLIIQGHHISSCPCPHLLQRPALELRDLHTHSTGTAVSPRQQALQHGALDDSCLNSGPAQPICLPAYSHALLHLLTSPRYWRGYHLPTWKVRVLASGALKKVSEEPDEPVMKSAPMNRPNSPLNDDIHTAAAAPPQ